MGRGRRDRTETERNLSILTDFGAHVYRFGTLSGDSWRVLLRRKQIGIDRLRCMSTDSILFWEIFL